MSNTNRKKKKYSKSPIAVTILLAIIGIMLAFLPALTNKNDGLIALLSTLGVELAVPPIVVLITYLFIGEKDESEQIVQLNEKIDILNSVVSDALHQKDSLPYLFLNMQNEFIQKNCITDRISDYILKSNELSGSDNLSELHIMTNELRHYDFTVISTLAIAINVQRNVKYIYYLPANSINDFKLLKNRVRDFIKKNQRSKSELDSWIRCRMIEDHKIIRFVEREIEGHRPSDIALHSFGYMDENMREKLEEEFSSLDLRNHKIHIPECVFDWLKGNSISENEKAVVKEFVCKIEKIHMCILRSGEILDPLAMRIEEVFSVITKMYHFSMFVVDANCATDTETNRLFDDVFDDENIQGISQLRKWVSEQISVCDDGEIDEILNNNLICIDISNMPIIKPCYSFCLYVQGITKRDVSLAWYTCHSDSEGSNRCMDNYITVYAPEHAPQERDRLINMYQKVIEYTPDAKQILKEADCKLLQIRGSHD